MLCCVILLLLLKYSTSDIILFHRSILYNTSRCSIVPCCYAKLGYVVSYSIVSNLTTLFYVALCHIESYSIFVHMYIVHTATLHFDMYCVILCYIVLYIIAPYILLSLIGYSGFAAPGWAAEFTSLRAWGSGFRALKIGAISA